MKITVVSKDLGFFTQTEIPVVRKEHGEVVWCNHANPNLEEVQNEVSRVDQTDIVWTDRLWVCRRCEAYKFDGDNEWHDAPVEGSHYE